MTTSPSLPLTSKLQIPQMGFGTYRLRDAERAVAHALQVGYRHLDSADIYDSHKPIARALAGSGLAREDVFITSKLWSHSVSAKRVGPTVQRFLDELETDYIDLLLIHWPANTPAAETLAAMDAARRAGQVRALGVSNFDIDLVQEALDSGIEFSNNQIEYNLNHQPAELLQFCLEREITVTAYSPLERGSREQETVLAQLAEKYNATREQVLLNWLMHKGMIVIPASSNPAHIESNFKAQDWNIEPADADALDAA
ncbi:MAG: aldo/keto reductase [Anaerolineales bacterium]|nr:aldo/keto reductase [Anaerolineales bacterium]